MSEDDTGKMDRRGWHIGKEIPLVLVAAVLIQTCGFIWSIAGLYNRVENLGISLNEMRQERYTKEDSRRDRDILAQWQTFQQAHDAEQDRRINNLEVLLSQYLRTTK